MDSKVINKELYQVINFIENGKKFIVLGHAEPDGDCLGSQLAASFLLRQLGKEVVLVSAGPFNRSEITNLTKLFKNQITQDDLTDADGAPSHCLVLDCAALDRMTQNTSDSTIIEDIAGLPLAMIDHHRSRKEDHDKGAIVYVDAEAPSTTYIVESLFEAFKVQPDAEATEQLFFGLCTDTGFFRHVEAGKPAAFECATKLVALGANPKKAFQKMHGSKSLNSRLLLSCILGRTETFFDGRLAFSYETLEESLKFGKESRDSDSLYQLLQAIEGVEAIAVIRQEDAQVCTVGLRSADKVNVAAIAAKHQGGGHYNAAGFTVKIEEGEPLKVLKDIILKEFGLIFVR
ncbi:MAG: bifunctional oligoribonuclease/PAP phosphatase NrnA [Spirochaetaceae bacterium]|jgi:phosphoesterase RecJ-like protein|nr:bifunctional oligoribonuclease/PAP phosphatase NrnA [Spirochaetaceae bacterium]